MTRRIFPAFFAALLLLAGCGQNIGGTLGAPVATPQLKHYENDLRKESVLTAAPYDQGMGSSAYGDGRYLIVYEDDRDNDSGMYGIDIWASILDENLKVVKEFPVYKHEGKDYGVRVLYDKYRNRFVVSWLSYGAWVSNHVGVMACFVDMDGNVSTPVVLPVSQLAASSASLRATADGYALLFLDTWVTYDMNVGYTVLKFAVLDEDLAVKSISWVTADTEDGIKVVPLGGVMDCSEDRCLFAYAMTKHILGRGGEQIYARFVSLVDGSLGAEMQVSETNPSQGGSNNTPAVVYGGGRFLVMWLDPFSIDGQDVKGKFVYPGDELGGLMVVSDFSADKSKPQTTGLNGVAGGVVACYRGSDDAFHVFWVDSRGGVPLENKLFYRKVDSSLLVNPTVLVNNMPGSLITVSAVVGGGGRIFVDWVNKGVSGSDLFGILY